MKQKIFMSAAATAILALAVFHLAARDGISASLQQLTEDAVSSDPTISSAAIAQLRAEGPEGLDALFKANASTIEKLRQSSAVLMAPETRDAWKRLQNALDGVSAQHDCSASRLYWHTDFDQAKAAARAAGIPILSLRLLGRLDEEYSCANSRFFRTTLYANTQVAEYLRDHFILHWKSVRPVPRITIDFGDGRKIERTITGNSIHYILDPEGHPIDALPGLYGPKAFLKGLADAEAAALKYDHLSAGVARKTFLDQYHRERLAVIQQSWRKDVMALNQPGATTGRSDGLQRVSNVTVPTALTAMPIAASKGAVELPMLTSFQNADDATWARVASLHAEDAVLDKSSTELIRSKNPTATEAGRVALTKYMVESPLTAMMHQFERSIAEDTVRNEYLLHSQIHEWFINGTAPQDLDRLNSLVYGKLFLTPDSDPWLGLVPDKTFTGLDSNGLVRNTRGQ